MRRQHRQRQRLTSQNPRPQICALLEEHIRRQGRQHNPVVALDLALELADGPAGIAREDPDSLDEPGPEVRIGIQVDHHDPAGHMAQPGDGLRVDARRAAIARHSAASRFTGPPTNMVLGLVANFAHCGSTL